MNFQSLALPAVILIAISGTVMLVSRNWRWSLGSLGVIYLGAFILVANTWPVELAVVKLVTGWMASSVIGITRINATPVRAEAPSWPTERIFRILAAALIAATAASFVPIILSWVPYMLPEQAWGGLLLIGFGLLHLGFSSRSIRVAFSLLMMLAGFEILYAVVEASTLVAALLALVNLGIALAGAYLMELPTMEEPVS